MLENPGVWNGCGNWDGKLGQDLTYQDKTKEKEELTKEVMTPWAEVAEYRKGLR